jgi:sec-independent protein translocase protein TatB
MFDIGPMDLLVLTVVAIIVIGPEKLPQLARDAARMIRTVRDLANSARTEFSSGLGLDDAGLDLRDLNPRTALGRLMSDEPADASTKEAS